MSSKFPVGSPRQEISPQGLDDKNSNSHFKCANADDRVCVNLDRPFGGSLTHRFKKDDDYENL